MSLLEQPDDADHTPQPGTELGNAAERRSAYLLEMILARLNDANDHLAAMREDFEVVHDAKLRRAADDEQRQQQAAHNGALRPLPKTRLNLLAAAQAMIGQKGIIAISRRVGCTQFLNGYSISRAHHTNGNNTFDATDPTLEVVFNRLAAVLSAADG